MRYAPHAVGRAALARVARLAARANLRKTTAAGLAGEAGAAQGHPYEKAEGGTWVVAHDRWPGGRLGGWTGCEGGD